MTSEILAALVRSNLAAAVAILALAAARPALRRLAGARMAYAAWLIVPIASAASLLPARSIVTIISPTPGAMVSPPGDAISVARSVLPAMTDQFRLNWTDAALGVWLLGAMLGLAWLLWRQHRFLAEIGPVRRDGPMLRACRSTAGPAVVGVFSPKILVPADFDQRFSPREREVVLAHEQNHLAQGDPQINALVLFWQCMNWFNPLAHVAARLLRLDQEFACDAAVMARFPKARRSYAEAMLKAQTAALALPLGCYWPAAATTALEQRLVLLKASPLSPKRHALGAGAAALLALLTSLAVWGAQPARRIVLQMSAAGASPPPSAFLFHAKQAAQAPVPVKAALADEASERPPIAMDAASAPIPESRPAPVDASPDAVASRAASFINDSASTWRPPQPPDRSRRRVEDGPPATVVNSMASWSPPQLQPGASIEISATTLLPTGRTIGEQISHSAGASSTSGTWTTDPHYILKPNARQLDNDRVEFRPALYLDGQLLGSGRAIVSGSGGGTIILLDNGQWVNVSAVLHPSADRPPRTG